MRNRMSELNPADVSRKNALDAKVTIEPYTEEQLRYISPGAAAFYNWVVFFHYLQFCDISLGGIYICHNTYIQSLICCFVPG